MPVKFIKKFTKWFFLVFNIICSIIFLLSCLALFVAPSRWTAIGFLSLSVPYISTILLLFIIFWLILKPRLALISIITLLIGWKQLSVLIAWHPSKTFNEQKSDTAFRVLTWNIRGLYGMSTNYYTQERNRTEIVELVTRLDADVVCLQEFNNSTNMKDPNADNIGLFTKKYPHYFFSEDVKSKTGDYAAGVIIFSKQPIINTGKIKYEGKDAESIIYVDILRGRDTIRIFTTHLQSFEFNGEDYANIEKIKDPDTEVIKASEGIYSKMRKAFVLRSGQVAIVKNELEKNTYPSVICGDFNDVPNSYTYFTIRGDRQDAFLKSSFGFGRSFNALAPTLRIDYIFPDENFIVNQFEMVDEGLSDHHLLLTNLTLKK
ncbi:endonuclease/exonuclease/phosphatase family protein [soil metagenome]